MFTSYAWAFKETWRGLCRDGRMLFLATALAGFALSVPLFIFTVVYGISEPIRSLPTAVEISVFTTEKADVKALTEEIEALPDIESVRHIPKETAFRELNEGLGVKRSKMHNPLPDLLVATVSDRADPDEIEKTASAMEKLEGVDMIAYESEWHTKLTVLTDVVRTGLLFLGGTIFLLVSLVLWAALRMTTLSARAEMRALYLFGATPLFAIRPWAWRGTLVMLAGGAPCNSHHGFGHSSSRRSDRRGRGDLRNAPAPGSAARALVRVLRRLQRLCGRTHRRLLGFGLLALGPLKWW